MPTVPKIEQSFLKALRRIKDHHSHRTSDQNLAFSEAKQLWENEARRSFLFDKKLLSEGSIADDDARLVQSLASALN